jgi:hypothetical protein
MERSSVLMAKVRELSEAYNDARTQRNEELMHLYNVELLGILAVVSATISNRNGNSRTDGGEQPRG